jgi:putative tryptophan/tyrosine transport system substrate-binding protein
MLGGVPAGLSRVARLVDPTLPGYQTYSLAVESAARSRGMATRVVEVREPDELAGAFAMIVKDHMQALVVLGSNFLFNERGRIAALAVTHRLPKAFPWREGPEEGALLSYGRNIRALWRRAAVYVDKILKGADPADLPVEQPTTFELVINVKTAKALGLTIPPSLLWRADEVIQ